LKTDAGIQPIGVVLNTKVVIHVKKNVSNIVPAAAYSAIARPDEYQVMEKYYERGELASCVRRIAAYAALH
jgi:hypothetical protein